MEKIFQVKVEILFWENSQNVETTATGATFSTKCLIFMTWWNHTSESVLVIRMHIHNRTADCFLLTHLHKVICRGYRTCSSCLAWNDNSNLLILTFFFFKQHFKFNLKIKLELVFRNVAWWWHQKKKSINVCLTCTWSSWDPRP